MREGKKRVTIGLALVIASVILMACALPAFALPTADNVGIADYTGEQGSYVIVPVTITNVQDGPIISVVFDVCYDKSVLEVVNVQNGDLTTAWNEPAFNDAFAWGTRVSLVYQGETAQGLQNGATGSIVLLNFSVSGEPGATSWMNLTTIEFSDTAYNLGTAPADNGTFTISAPPTVALPTADNVGIADYTGEQGLYVIVPVTITNVQEGPIISVVFDVCYDKSVLEVVNVQNGDLTTAWNEPAFNDAFAWGTRVSLVYQGETAQGLQNGATGSIVLLNFSVSGEPGSTSWMNLTTIEFSDTAYNLGTAPADNGTITISESLPEEIVDSFEIDEWNGLWMEDSQKDWYRSTQRATDGSYSAEVDGRARDATLTMADPVDLSGKASAKLTFSWFIEDSWDRGDYLALDIYDGTWHEVKRLSGNEDQENVWHHETIDLTPYMVSSFKIRFRATVSNSVEEGNVDNVKITSATAG